MVKRMPGSRGREGTREVGRQRRKAGGERLPVPGRGGDVGVSGYAAKSSLTSLHHA